MSIIDGIFIFLLNTMWDIRDNIENGRSMKMGDNIISLVCLVSEDLPITVCNMYCESLEVIYATLIRSLLSVRSMSRMNSTPKHIFRAMPMLTPYDSVDMDKKAGTFSSVVDHIWNRKYTGGNALDVFVESLQEKMIETYEEFGMEDVILKESRGAAPTYVDIVASIYQLNGKPVEKTFSIGIEVRPKIVSNVELASMIIKEDKRLTDVAAGNWWEKMKSVFTFNLGKAKRDNLDSKSIGGLTDMMNRVRGVKKPFVCILMSNVTEDILQEAGVTITEKKVVDRIYDRLPIMSIGIYDTNTDTINLSLMKNAYFTKRTAGEFNSEISSYERQLSELVRVNKVFG